MSPISTQDDPFELELGRVVRRLRNLTHVPDAAMGELDALLERFGADEDERAHLLTSPPGLLADMTRALAHDAATGIAFDDAGAALLLARCRRAL